jgi:hypothetical protein
MSEPYSKADKRFAQAVRSSGLVAESELDRALEFQAKAAKRGRALPLDRILLKFGHLDRDQILGLWRALRYYLWRKEDKFYVKLAVQSKLLNAKTAKICLREQKQAYKHEDQLIRVNEIARQRGYLDPKGDQAIVDAMRKVRPVTLRPVGSEKAADPYERPSAGAARAGGEGEWLKEARKRDLDELRAVHESQSLSQREASDLINLSSAERDAFSDEDLDALWEEAELSDVELDSQAMEIARSPLFEPGDDDSDEIDLFSL